MKFNEIANIFPLMAEVEFDQLKADIAENGLIEPVWTYQDTVLDGRNRYLACNDLGIEPQYQEYTGNDPQSFVISKNLHRRHLNETQMAIVASKLANMHQGQRTDLVSHDTKLSLNDAAGMLNVGRATVARVKQVEREAPDLMPKLESGEMTAGEAVKEISKRDREFERKEMADSAQSIPVSDRWHIEVGDVNSYQTDKQYDFIITDPPYPREYLPLYETLAIRASEWLKPGGLLIAMCGQSYLNSIYEMMSRHLDYYWTAAYLTPGQPTPLRQVNVNTTWKPLIMLTNGKYTGKIFGDVFKSDGNDKDFHKWGQSVSGMYSIVSGVCLPGQSIFDPFCGAGTTGIAALQHGCLFDGIDIEEDNVKISSRRLHDSSTQR